MRIDLGGGRRPKEGYTSVDLYRADLICDIMQGLPFEDNSIERIYSHHCLEHLREEKIGYVLSECYRVIAPQAEFEITVPDFDGAVELVKMYETDSRHLEWVGMIFGGMGIEDEFQDYHMTVFTETKLRRQLLEAGFDVGKFDYPNWYGRNLHVTARKP